MVTQELRLTEFWLIRHGESRENRDGRFLANSEVPLSSFGIAQAERLSKRLGPQQFAAVYSSDMRRAVETALLLSAPLGLSVQQVPELREIQFSGWGGLTWKEIAENYPEEWAALEEADPHLRIGGSTESFAEAQQRVVTALDRIAQSHPGERVLIVSHSTAIRHYISHILGLPLNEFRHLGEVRHCAISRVRPFGAPRLGGNRGRPGVVVVVNDAAHLEGLTRSSIQGE